MAALLSQGPREYTILGGVSGDFVMSSGHEEEERRAGYKIERRYVVYREEEAKTRRCTRRKKEKIKIHWDAFETRNTHTHSR